MFLILDAAITCVQDQGIPVSRRDRDLPLILLLPRPSSATLCVMKPVYTFYLMS